MIAADVVRAAAHGVLALLVATGTVRVTHMVVIGVVFGTAQAFFQPAYTGLVPQTVAEGQIQSAQALGGVTRELASIAGPALGTTLVLTVGGAWAFGLDAATFAVSALTLLRVRARQRGDPGAGGGMLSELREGFSAVQQRAWVWATIAGFSFAILVALAPFFVLGPAVSREVYGTEAVYGVVNTVWGVGTVLGALIGGRWRPHRPMRTGLLLGLAWPAQIACFAIGPPVAVLYPVTALAGLGLGLFDVWWVTALAQRIPPHLLSRVSAWDWMGSLALMPLGYLAAGPVGAALGEVRVLALGGVLGTVSMVAALLPRSTRELRRFEPDPETEPRPPGTTSDHDCVTSWDRPEESRLFGLSSPP
jgi:predicted MFS family arabinose efflux permease